MKKYRISETQNVLSNRDAATIEAADLTAAKRAASRLQMFHGTVLKVAAANGVLLSIKKDGAWIDVKD